ncbi:hypothetical protein ACFLYF_02935 [Chloroflexota bacterium]
MVKWRVKGCPRCGGDMFLETGMEGWFWDCLLCGFRDEVSEVELNQKAGQTK